MPDFARALKHLRPRESPQRQLFQTENPVASLSRQLAFLKSKPSITNSVSQASPPLDGIEEETPFGRHLVIRRVYDDGHYHGKVRLGRFSTAELERFFTLMKAKGSVPGRDRIVFLDTETTGIQGGTGMAPFLVGLGFCDGDDFHVVQYFIRDFDEEPSMLLALSNLLLRFNLVVTYNGASFDVPLLETRFTLARLDSPFSGLGHLDLLPGARRLWRQGHGSCRLAALEKGIAGFLRGPDVPGAMIPQAYFDFLQGRGSAVMAGVMRHNVDDILSLAALTVCACDRLSAPPVAWDDPLDVYSLARILENTAEWRRALSLYELALSGGLPEPVRSKACEGLAVLARRQGDHRRSLALCEELMAGAEFSMAAYEGAAIHYERIEGDAARALEIVERALTCLEGDPQRKSQRAALNARRERLRQKAISF